MRFYVIVHGELAQRTWCDNPHCAFYSTRGGIPGKVEIIVRNGKHFCCPVCEAHAKEVEARLHAARVLSG